MTRYIEIVLGIAIMGLFSYGCDSIVDQNTINDVNVSASELLITHSVDQSLVECIDPDDPEYHEFAESKTIEWGNRRKPFSKTVDITYYNTLTEFVLKVRSTEKFADVLADDKSIKNFKGTAAPDVWHEFTFDLEPDWQAGDPWSFGLKVAGNGPPVSFDVEYELIGECVTDCGEVTFTYAGVEVTYGTVIGANNRCWLDRNLGADRVAEALDDVYAYGDLFQWGRPDDGHQLIDRVNGVPISGTTNTLSDTDQPGHGDFILVGSSPYDWRTPPNENLWQGVNGINNPCPSGYRVPDENEWRAERESWVTKDREGAFASPLKLTAAGIRYNIGGGNDSDTMLGVGSYGRYWTSDIKGPRMSITIEFFRGDGTCRDSIPTCSFLDEENRGEGLSVRCIKDEN